MYDKFKIITIFLLGFSLTFYDCKGAHTMELQTGILSVQNDHAKQVTLKWERIAGNTARLTEKIHQISNVLIPAYTEIELNFALKQPHAVANDFMLKSLAPLIEKGIEKEALNREINKVIEQFFSATDWAGYSKPEEQYVFVIAEIEGKEVGAIQFMISPEFNDHNVRIGLFGVLPNFQHTDLEKILMGSIFKLEPATIRLFLHARESNQRAIDLYLSWGFKEYPGKLPGWPDFEYLAQESKVLQEKK